MAMNNKNDNRSKKIVFCSSCLLNTNNKVLPLARYGGFSKEFIDILAKYDLGVQQMDCPETLYLGIQRWQHTKNLYDNVGFRRHCRQLAEKEVDYMYSYMQMDYDTVAVLCCDGSPTCGCGLTSWDENWGGPPEAPLDYGNAVIEGVGVFVDEMQKAIRDRGLPMPPFYGLGLDDASQPFDHDSIRPQWREATESLGGNTFQYWTRVAGPILAPRFISAFLLLFASAFSAYATAAALFSQRSILVPLMIQGAMRNEMDPNQQGFAQVLAFAMIVVVAVVMMISHAVEKRAGRWQ